jgi:predicted tellurium resistance membrane protein TerC
MDIIGLLGKGIGSTGLDVDNALYMTSMTGAVKQEEQDKLIFWGIAAEFIGRVILLAIALYAFSGDEPLFTIGGIGFTPPMVAALVAGVFLLWTNGGELYEFFKGSKKDDKAVKKQTLTRALGEMTAVNLLLSIDTVVADPQDIPSDFQLPVLFGMESPLRDLDLDLNGC